jgi:hypothetical protein
MAETGQVQHFYMVDGAALAIIRCGKLRCLADSRSLRVGWTETKAAGRISS